MTKRIIRISGRVTGSGLIVASLVTLALCAYCFIDVLSFTTNAQRLKGTIIDVKRSVAEEQRGTAGFRPVVSVAMPSGKQETVHFTGLYRVEAGTVGKQMTLLYNPTHRVRLAPDSPWNGIGSIVYGSATLGLLLLGVLTLVVVRRWAGLSTVASTNPA